MADEILKRDANNEPVAGFVTDDTAKEIRMARIDDTTKGLKVVLVGGVGAGDVIGPAGNTADYIPQWNGTDSKTLKNGISATTWLLKTGGTMTGKVVSSGSSEVGKTYTPAAGSQTVALDCALNNMHIVSGHANGTAITFTIANDTNNQCFIVSILQGGTTVSTIAGWFATIRWAGGTAPTLTATLNKRDTFGFIRTGTNTYDGFIIGQNC